METYLIGKEKIGDFEYPSLFFKLIELNLLDFDIWFIMDSDLAEKIMNGLKRRYPNRRQLIPFAKRADNDDLACFEIGKGLEIQIIHDYSSEGYEQRGVFASLGEWLIQVVKEMVSRDDED